VDGFDEVSKGMANNIIDSQNNHGNDMSRGTSDSLHRHKRTAHGHLIQDTYQDIPGDVPSM
jgi:hypothetical protein